MTPSDDEQHLQLLSIFHYVVGGMLAVFACFPMLHFGFGLALMVASFFQEKDAAPMLALGLLLSAATGFFIVLGWTFAACIAFAGRQLALRKRYRYCLVMAGLECIFSPLGTVLGVFTIVVLTRPSVKALFAGPPPVMQPPSS